MMDRRAISQAYQRLIELIARFIESDEQKLFSCDEIQKSDYGPNIIRFCRISRILLIKYLKQQIRAF